MFQLAVEIGVIAAGRPTVPFLGDPQIGQGQTGNGRVAAFQQAFFGQVQAAGDLGRFRQDVEAVEPLADPPAEAPRLGLGQAGIVKPARRLLLGLLSKA